MNMSGPKSESQPAQLHLENAAVGAPRILVADDDAVIVGTISNALKRAGYAVTAVSDGSEAWKALEGQSFDLFLTDEQMPGLTGHELILKARQHQFNFPIIVMSAQPDFFLDPKNKNLRVAQLLRKPFGLREMADAVTRVLRSTLGAAARLNSAGAQTGKTPTD
jgi:DNA-binding response OmpR family regulator